MEKIFFRRNYQFPSSVHQFSSPLRIVLLSMEMPLTIELKRNAQPAVRQIQAY